MTSPIFWNFWTLPAPLLPILLNMLMEKRYLLADPPSPLSGWRHLWMAPNQLLSIIFRITSPEDMEAKYLRLLGMSLLGYGKYFELLAKCTVDKIDKLLEKAKTLHSKIFSDSKFWKLAHHNTVSVSFFFNYYYCNIFIQYKH